MKHKEVAADFKSDDITIHEEQPSDLTFPGVNIYSELPVHGASQGKGLDQGGSAWLLLMSFLTKEGYALYVESKNSMQYLREHVFPGIRRTATYAKRQDWMRLKKSLEKSPIDQMMELNDRHPYYSFGRYLDLCFIPIVDIHTKTSVGQEILDLQREAEKLHPAEYARYLNDAFNSQGFADASGRCLDTLLRLFDLYDSLILPLATEQFKPEWRNRLHEFRVYRDDFEVLKGVYQDIFESMNQLLVWLGMVANLSKRGNLKTWSNGATATFSKASKWRSVDKEFIIKEFPQCQALITQASRSLRNNIGHFKVHYDIVSGQVVFEKGTSSSLLLFHEDLLAAARLMTVLITFCEKQTLDFLKIVRKEDMEGWRGRK